MAMRRGQQVLHHPTASGRSASFRIRAIPDHVVGDGKAVRRDANSKSAPPQRQQRPKRRASSERSLAELQMEMEALQRQIHDAHVEAHVSERKMAAAAANLATLEKNADMMRTSYENSLEGEAPSSTKPTKRSNPKNNKRGKQASQGLKSTLEWPEELKEFWFPVDFSANLKREPVAVEAFDFPVVLFRDAEGKAACVMDQCAHRACPLSLGDVVDGTVRCPYHGWRFDAEGHLVDAPSTRLNEQARNGKACGGIGVRHFPTAEKDGMVWIWPGEGPPAMCDDGETFAIPDYTKPPAAFEGSAKDFVVHAELVIDVPAEHGLLLENLLDLAHAPFTHTSTFAKGWSVPDLVNFKMQDVLGGNWEPYPIDMSFEPPCCVLSTIGLEQPGKLQEGMRAETCTKHLHQLHVCIPTRTGTRLLYRMSLDFMGFMQHVPFSKNLWSAMATQVLGEDLRLVQGQQDRLARGGDTWANPMAYDKLAVRYRRWRNALSSDCPVEREEAEKGVGKRMSAGEMLRPDDDEEHEQDTTTAAAAEITTTTTVCES